MDLTQLSINLGYLWIEAVRKETGFTFVWQTAESIVGYWDLAFGFKIFCSFY